MSYLFSILIVCLFASIATWSSFQLARVARILTLIQLLVVSWLINSFFVQWFHLTLQPLALFSGIVLGFFIGWILRLAYRRREKKQAQYFELLLKNKELEETRLQLVKQDEIERRLLAADLHDQVLNDLKSVKHKFEELINSKELNQNTTKTISDSLNTAMDAIREVMESLCPSILEHLGLQAAIEDCLRRGSEKAQFKTRFKSQLKKEDFDFLSLVAQVLLFRLVQESITNICKHAYATQVIIEIEDNLEQLIIKVIDNGKGLGDLSDDSRGIKYMRLRADLIDATINWQQGQDGKGTIVEIRVNKEGKQDVITKQLAGKSA